MKLLLIGGILFGLTSFFAAISVFWRRSRALLALAVVFSWGALAVFVFLMKPHLVWPLQPEGVFLGVAFLLLLTTTVFGMRFRRASLFLLPGLLLLGGALYQKAVGHRLLDERSNELVQVFIQSNPLFLFQIFCSSLGIVFAFLASVFSLEFLLSRWFEGSEGSADRAEWNRLIDQSLRLGLAFVLSGNLLNLVWRFQSSGLIWGGALPSQISWLLGGYLGILLVWKKESPQRGMAVTMGAILSALNLLWLWPSF